MTRRQIVTTLIFIAAFSMGAAASQKPAAEEPGAIRGVVTREGTTTPISGAQVTLQGGAANPQALQVLLNTAASQGIVVKPEPGASTSEIIQSLSNAAVARGFPLTTANLYTQLASLSGKTPPTTMTDEDGRFSFKDVSPGTYTVRVQKEGFFGKSEGGFNPATAATDVDVVAGKTAEADPSMIAGAIIGGRIFDEKGQLMSNANVQAFTVAYAFGRATLAPQVSKVTDDRGEFRLFWVPPGEYYLAATTAPVAPAPGVPAATSPLRTYYPGVADIAQARTVTITGGEDMTGTNFPIHSVRAFKVSGQVNSLIPPSPTQIGFNGAALFMLNRDAVAPDDSNGRLVGAVPLLPSTGQFEISNVLPGVYELLARVADPAAQVAGGLPLAWGRARLEVKDMDVTNISIVVSPSSEVTGTLTASTGVKLPPSLRVQLLPDDASIRVPAFQAVLARSAMVGPDGTFKFPAVPEGHYRVMTAAGLTPDLYLADVRHKAVSVFDAGFDVRPGVNDPIQVLVGSGAGAVSGIVKDAQDGASKVVAGATVALVPEATRRENLALYLSAATDASGQFVIRGVPPGDYKLFAWESVRPFAYQNAAFIAKDENRGRSIHVAQGNTVKAELIVIR